MTVSRKKIRLGVPFAISVPNVREQNLEIINLNDQPFDELKCEILNSTSYAPPVIRVTDAINNIVNCKFIDNSIPLNTPLELIIQGFVRQKIEVIKKTVLLDGTKTKEAAAKATSSVWRAFKFMFLSFAIASFGLYFIKGSIFGNFIIDIWKHFNAAQMIEIVDELDPRIHTNRHVVYQSAAFTEFNALYKRNFGAKKELSRLYNFVGQGFFVTKDLIYEGDELFLVTKSDADDYCEMIGGRLLEIQELLSYLAGQYLTIENFMWPIELRPQTPEWSGTKHSWWDNFYLYIKDSENPIKEEPLTKNKFVVADDGDIKAAFRCGFGENMYLAVK